MVECFAVWVRQYLGDCDYQCPAVHKIIFDRDSSLGRRQTVSHGSTSTYCPSVCSCIYQPQPVQSNRKSMAWGDGKYIDYPDDRSGEYSNIGSIVKILLWRKASMC